MKYTLWLYFTWQLIYTSYISFLDITRLSRRTRIRLKKFSRALTRNY